MSGLENLNTRIEYRGGKQQDRLISGKLAALKRALLYSYQAATAILADGREFRCLINPDKLKINYDDKIISIPFEDVCLNNKPSSDRTNQIQTIGMKAGDVFTWKETSTDWLVFLQRLEEKAYFRAEIRKCDYSLDVDGKSYKIFARKKSLEDIEWHTSKGISWNDLNYSLELYITKDEITKNYFSRFKVIKIDDKPWEVQAVDTLSTEGIVIVALKEFYSNSIEEELEKEKEENKDTSSSILVSKIEGPRSVYPYDEVEYKITDAEGGIWAVNGTKAKIINQTETAALVTITTGRSGEFELIYKRDNMEDIVTTITIESL